MSMPYTDIHSELNDVRVHFYVCKKTNTIGFSMAWHSSSANAFAGLTDHLETENQI